MCVCIYIDIYMWVYTSIYMRAHTHTHTSETHSWFHVKHLRENKFDNKFDWQNPWNQIRQKRWQIKSFCSKRESSALYQRHQLVGLVFSSHEHFPHEHFPHEHFPHEHFPHEQFSALYPRWNHSYKFYVRWESFICGIVHISSMWYESHSYVASFI